MALHLMFWCRLLSLSNHFVSWMNVWLEVTKGSQTQVLKSSPNNIRPVHLKKGHFWGKYVPFVGSQCCHQKYPQEYFAALICITFWRRSFPVILRHKQALNSWNVLSTNELIYMRVKSPVKMQFLGMSGMANFGPLGPFRDFFGPIFSGGVAFFRSLLFVTVCSWEETWVSPDQLPEPRPLTSRSWLPVTGAWS